MAQIPKVALIHDWLNQVGGAENVLETLVRMHPGSPVFTSIYARELMPAAYQAWDVRTSFMQHLPGVTRHHQAYLPLYPLAFHCLTVEGYDLLLSNKSGFCHFVRTPAGARHICYCLAPTRFLWQYELYHQREGLPAPVASALRPLVTVLRRLDYAAAQAVDDFIAISTAIQSRIRDYYRRSSTIIYPPVDLRRFSIGSGPPDDYYLAGGRLIPYKRVDLAVAACTELGLKLVVFGDGRDRPALERMAGPSVTFTGRVPADELARLYRGARAFIFPGLEDFGIAPVEAQASGRPVIALAAGGALDTVLPGSTGELFPEPSTQSLMTILQSFDPLAYDPAACRANAERFSTERFVSELRQFLDGRVADQCDRKTANGG
jgi:glycosyltransferase involved in cell wall biosynthesis